MRSGATSYRAFAIVLLGLALALTRMAGASSGEDVPSPAFAARWAEIEKLTAQNKLAAAEERADALRAEARAAGDEETWARALARAVETRESLGKREGAVRLLEKEARPSEAVHRLLFDLLYARALEHHATPNNWKISERQRVEWRPAYLL